MNYLTIENASKTFGEKTLFKDLNLSINEGDKIALVAKNGTGKSTLLKILNGEESVEGEQAKILFKKDINIAYLTQESQLLDELSVLDEALNSDSPQIKAIQLYEKAMLAKDQEAIQDAITKIEDLKAWDIEAKVKEILGKLKILNLDQKVKHLSGGQKKRLSLAKVLISNPDFLILDEPTNHLDLEMIEWLEEFLQQPNLTVFMVTHDRYFLERVCNIIIDLDERKLASFKGNYSEYLEKKASIQMTEQANLAKMKKLYSKELNWIRRQPKARGTKAKSRVDKFDEIKEKAHQNITQDEVEFVIQSERLGSKILEAYYVHKSFGDLKVLNDFYYKFKKGEKIGVVGPNGVGKSSFIKLLTQQIQPDEGKVVVGETVKFGIFAQDGLELSEDQRVIDVVRNIAEYIPLEKGMKLTATSLLEKFLFSRDQQQVYYSQLSGGEKRRLYLLTVLMQNPNFLILDEPTNDLDIVTLNVLEEYLRSFTGCLLIISHDRYFMDKIVDHIFILRPGGIIKDFNGNYSEFKLREKEFFPDKSTEKKKVVEVEPAPAPQKNIDNQKKLSYKDKHRMDEIEKLLAKNEKRKDEITEKFSDSSLSSDKMSELSKEMGILMSEIEDLEMEWMEIADKVSKN
ncbi:ABC-F family ATP-binding cassette domain-containing protein [Portibacter lacus]|uniref:ABC transporter ATP-binding protein n=1 Tax=Portibacter lacus TaxID=1099794 RepID=A0AA37WH87_9BACT|nr:ABC-F family ATP-binding cassette domain-containing protein [Portibacter lacus]GLR19109.1 ABC transporter ATP-binding protein [Portibacter lacus]